MTLWRWLNDPALNFPRPIYIGNRRYWREADVLEWLDSQEARPSPESRKIADAMKGVFDALKEAK